MKRRFDGGVFRWDWRSESYRARTSVAMMRDDWRAGWSLCKENPILSVDWIGILG